MNFPEKIKAVYDDEALRDHLTSTWVYVGGEGFYAVTCKQNVEKLPIVVAYSEAVKKRNVALQQLKGVAYGVSTLKALREALPELTKYMADEEKKVTPGLPVPANVFSDLKAVGLK